MLNDSFFGWRYRLMPNIPKENWRYNIDYLVLYLIEDGQSDLLQSYFETVITPQSKNGPCAITFNKNINI